MEVILRPTDKIVLLAAEKGSPEIPARVWEGKTSTGIPMHAYITRVAVAKDRPAHELEEFEKALEETEPPTPEIAAIDMRLIL